MAHFAEIDETNVVLTVIVINNETIDYLPFPESEPVGQEFIASIGLTGQWLQCSYNDNFRGLYPGPTYRFNPLLGEYGEFIPPPEPEPIAE